eukprot:1176367-Alexandrium_andersonii.AAC.1
MEAAPVRHRPALIQQGREATASSNTAAGREKSETGSIRNRGGHSARCGVETDRGRGLNFPAVANPTPTRYLGRTGGTSTG